MFEKVNPTLVVSKSIRMVFRSLLESPKPFEINQKDAHTII